MYDYPANTAIFSPGEVRGYKALLIEISGVFSIVRQNGHELFNIFLLAGHGRQSLKGHASIELEVLINLLDYKIINMFMKPTNSTRDLPLRRHTLFTKTML